SDLSIAYANLSRRWDYSVAAYHFANFFQGTRTSSVIGRVTTIERFRNFGLGGSISYPFTRFKRLDLGVNWFNIHQEELLYGEEVGFTSETISTVLMTAGYNYDNAVWAYTGPFFGDRINFGITFSPKLGGNGLGFTTMNGDLRRYFMLGREYSLALRLAGGASVGQNPTRFLLGGVTNWINYKFARDIDFDLVRDFYFSQFVSPLRGADYYERIGDRYFIFNAELKFPLIQYFITRFPIPLGFQNVRGAIFTDIGSAWSGNSFRAFTRNENGDRIFQDIVGGFGWGLRTPFLIGLLRLDQAWSTDLSQISKPKWYVSFGIDF
ncbi:MAG: BamA/TamA family outer membrane protein, partial [bacterium]